MVSQRHVVNALNFRIVVSVNSRRQRDAFILEKYVEEFGFFLMQIEELSTVLLKRWQKLNDLHLWHLF